MVDDVVFIWQHGGASGIDIIGEQTMECGEEERDEVTLPAIVHVGANDGDLGSWLPTSMSLHPPNPWKNA